MKVHIKFYFIWLSRFEINMCNLLTYEWPWSKVKDWLWSGIQKLSFWSAISKKSNDNAYSIIKKIRRICKRVVKNVGHCLNKVDSIRVLNSISHVSCSSSSWFRRKILKLLTYIEQKLKLGSFISLFRPTILYSKH